MKYAPLPEADGFAERKSFYYKDTMFAYAAACMRLNKEANDSSIGHRESNTQQGEPF